MTAIISLGGSIIAPEKININFLKKFKELIIKFVKKNYRFVIYCGGGALARSYQSSASEISKMDSKELDWLGIKATVLNACLLKTILGGYAEDRIITNPTEKISSKKPILIAAGWKPGWSTDYDAVLLAKNMGIDAIINVTNVDYVYDKNPKKYKDAKPIKKLSWQEFRRLVGDKWGPGLNMPFDPIAAREAEKLKLKVIIIGKDLKNLENALNKKRFKGSVIS